MPTRYFACGVSRHASADAYFYCRFHRRQFSSLSPSNSFHDGEPSTVSRKRRLLPHGRSRRKLEVRRRNDALSSSRQQVNKGEEQKQESQVSRQDDDMPAKEDTSSTHIELNDNWHIAEILRDKPMGNPIRQAYIESQIPWKYPRTIEGWRTCFRRAWNTYLWTWEGILVTEKIRDEHGNIIGVKGKEVEEDNDTTNTKEIVKDKATEAATQIAQNVQSNVMTMKREAPKILSAAQKITGISTRDELKQWVSEQLKLGTECLSMFMKGYREGRDEEVDNMLHEYFKELDEGKESENSSISDDNTQTEPTGNEANDAATRTRTRIIDDRSWGRKSRRKKTRKQKQLPIDETNDQAVA